MAATTTLNQSRCRAAVADALRQGVLPAEPARCEACGVAGHRNRSGGGIPKRNGTPRKPRWSIVYHHHSYLPEFWLDVAAVCDRCHQRIHLGQIPEPRTGELRSGERAKPRHARPHGLPAPELVHSSPY